MNDLVRSRAALIGFGFLCRATRPAGHTTHDGIVSITRSFTKKELMKILHGAGLLRPRSNVPASATRR